MARRPRVLYLAPHSAQFYRTVRFGEALRTAWPGAEVCVPDENGWRSRLRWLPRALRAARRADIVIAGFWGQPLVPILRLLGKRRILLDVYALTHSRYAMESDSTRKNGLAALAYLIDWAAFRLTHRALLLTEYHRRWMGRKYRVPGEKILLLPLTTGSLGRTPQPEPDGASEIFRVHWHGRHLAHHGVDVILEAAHILRNEPVHFTMVGGKGPCLEENRATAARLGLGHVTFMDDVPYAELRALMARSHVCLGLFGSSRRSRVVINNKVIDGFAAGRAVITGRNRPSVALLEGRPAAHFVPLGDPAALAGAILLLRNDPARRRALAEEGHRLHEERFTGAAFARRIREILELISRAGERLE